MREILIIEDDLPIAEIERDYLEIQGCHCLIEQNGAKGLAVALKGAFDLILLDIMLPGMDGFELCKTLRKQLDIPILLVTAKKEDLDKIRGLGLGADDYIVKPFSPGELCARVASHLARYERLTKKPDTDLLRLGKLTINPRSRRVFKNDQEIALKNKEFDLLLFLASNPDVVFSKDTLFEKLWGMDALGDSSTVTVHINRLREKLGDDGTTPPCVETVWGAGYRFRC